MVQELAKAPSRARLGAGLPIVPMPGRVREPVRRLATKSQTTSKAALPCRLANSRNCPGIRYPRSGTAVRLRRGASVAEGVRERYPERRLPARAFRIGALFVSSTNCFVPTGGAVAGERGGGAPFSRVYTGGRRSTRYRGALDVAETALCTISIARSGPCWSGRIF